MVRNKLLVFIFNLNSWIFIDYYVSLDVTRDKEYLELEAQYKQFVKYSDELFSETVAYRDSLLGIVLKRGARRNARKSNF